MTAATKVRLFVPMYKARGTVFESFIDLECALRRRGYDLHVLVIDDGSKDVCSDVLAGFVGDARFMVARWHTKNLGNAVTIEEGYNWALEDTGPNDLVGCCDADGEHDPLAFVRHIDDLVGYGWDGIAGSIIYPQHCGEWSDLNMMRFLGGLQAKMSGADQPFYVQSPGWNLHDAGLMRKVIRTYLPAYRQFYRTRTGQEFPRWGFHGVILTLLGAAGARLHTAYLECYGPAPQRPPEKLFAQAEAGMQHARLLQEFLVSVAGSLR